MRKLKFLVTIRAMGFEHSLPIGFFPTKDDAVSYIRHELDAFEHLTCRKVNKDYSKLEATFSEDGKIVGGIYYDVFEV